MMLKTNNNFVQNNWLKCRIQLYRSGDQNACYEIIEAFSKLIKIYAYKLKIEDAYHEIVVYLLDILMCIDINRFDDESNSIQRYIAVSIRNRYIELAKAKYQEDIILTNLPVNDGLYSNNLIPLSTDRLFCQELLKVITPRQREVLIYNYIYGYSIEEISKILKISRQAANGLRLRAIQDLRKRYEM